MPTATTTAGAAPRVTERVGLEFAHALPSHSVSQPSICPQQAATFGGSKKKPAKDGVWAYA
ncbi:hypothetical protein F442_15340, partial [Phytophthora nicotianae P10297]